MSLPKNVQAAIAALKAHAAKPATSKGRAALAVAENDVVTVNSPGGEPNVYIVDLGDPVGKVLFVQGLGLSQFGVSIPGAVILLGPDGASFSVDEIGNIQITPGAAEGGVVIQPSTGSNGVRMPPGGIQDYADNDAAIAAGLTVNDMYRTGDFQKIVHA